MKIYEYQAKKILANEGIDIPSGQVADTPEKAADIGEELGTDLAVKSQVHAGGRGKAGGIKFVSSPKEARDKTEDLLGSELKGEKISQVLLEKKQKIEREFYLGITLNREEKETTLIFSSSGGMDIEEVAEKQPEKILRLTIDPLTGLHRHHFNEIHNMAELEGKSAEQLEEIAKKLYGVYKKYDCLLVEINPLALLDDNNLLALDAKLQADDNASYRQEQIVDMLDEDKEEPLELIGRQAGFVVIKLNGSVSIISNGAGLALTTLDLLSRHETDVANILDLGGGATAEEVNKAVNVVKQDEDAETVLFNIFGGITRCNEIANGVKKSLQDIPDELDIVCRLQGTNREKGIKILQDAGLEASTKLDKVVKKASKLQKAGEIVEHTD